MRRSTAAQAFNSVLERRAGLPGFLLRPAGTGIDLPVSPDEGRVPSRASVGGRSRSPCFAPALSGGRTVEVARSPDPPRVSIRTLTAAPSETPVTKSFFNLPPSGCLLANCNQAICRFYNRSPCAWAQNNSPTTNQSIVQESGFGYGARNAHDVPVQRTGHMDSRTGLASWRKTWCAVATPTEVGRATSAIERIAEPT